MVNVYWKPDWRPADLLSPQPRNYKVTFLLGHPGWVFQPKSNHLGSPNPQFIDLSPRWLSLPLSKPLTTLSTGGKPLWPILGSVSCEFQQVRAFHRHFLQRLLQRPMDPEVLGGVALLGLGKGMGPMGIQHFPGPPPQPHPDV